MIAKQENLSASLAPSGMTVVRSVTALRRAVAAWRLRGDSIGLIPTMGSLHAGHLSLVQQAKAETDRAIATIFVNPKQFDRAEDLDGYPRAEEKDAALLQSVGCDLLFAPGLDEIYPEGFSAQVSVRSALTSCLEGQHRPGHFDGVTTVVCKLLLQAGADRAYFGEKDFQQLQVVRKMVADLAIPTEIVPCVTIREVDGLALSSRNVHLSAAQRARAPQLFTVLRRTAAHLLASPPGTRSALLEQARQSLLAEGFDKIDYLALRHAEALDQPLGDGVDLRNTQARLLVAAWLGDTRLIDNLALADCPPLAAALG
jgi:pantoate--beta-alanine ligase|tara:strand:- start:5962 stop:6903 length:942 start_codon:yes stop_codon:yes gene_type:complete